MLILSKKTTTCEIGYILQKRALTLPIRFKCTFIMCAYIFAFQDQSVQNALRVRVTYLQLFLCLFLEVFFMVP